MTNRPHLRWAALIVVVAVAVDQATKFWAQSRLNDGRTISIMPTLEFDLTYNSGFSFSTGTGYGSLIGVLVSAVSVVLVVMIIRETSVRRALLMAVILGGALGNLGDRIFRAKDGFLSGEVVDFIDVSWYAVFNLADSFVVGSVLVIIGLEVHANRTTPTSNL